MRGEFIRGDGLVIPNNVTNSGRAQYLKMIFNGVDGTPVIDPGSTFFFGLSNAVPADVVDLTVILEPTIGVEGYARQAVARSTVGFPNQGVSNGEPFIETADIVFVATGAGFDAPISRLFLTPEATALVGQVWALSAALSAPLTILTSTPLANRTFRYRAYMR